VRLYLLLLALDHLCEIETLLFSEGWAGGDVDGDEGL
jgi:hypothetical protein